VGAPARLADEAATERGGGRRPLRGKRRSILSAAMPKAPTPLPTSSITRNSATVSAETLAELKRWDALLRKHVCNELASVGDDKAQRRVAREFNREGCSIWARTVEELGDVIMRAAVAATRRVEVQRGRKATLIIRGLRLSAETAVPEHARQLRGALGCGA
jgi:hypothetical protein